MSCFVCGKKTWISHHVSYEPEITFAICEDCHDRIHNHDLYLLCPRKAKWWCSEDTIEIMENSMPFHLRGYVKIAWQSKLINRKEFYERKTN